MEYAEPGPGVRLLAVARSRTMGENFARWVEQQGLAVLVADIGQVLAATDAPVILFYTQQWDKEAASALARFEGIARNVLVICPEADKGAIRDAIVSAGATDALPADPHGLHELAVKARRLLLPRPQRLLCIGGLHLDLITQRLSHGGHTLQLTQGEAHLLALLYDASRRGHGCASTELASRMGASEARVYNLVSSLRDKIEGRLGYAPILQYSAKQGYVLDIR